MTQSLNTKMNLDDNEQGAGPRFLGTYFRVLRIQNQYQMKTSKLNSESSSS